MITCMQDHPVSCRVGPHRMSRTSPLIERLELTLSPSSISPLEDTQADISGEDYVPSSMARPNPMKGQAVRRS
jgi:hypothetical protein